MPVGDLFGYIAGAVATVGLIPQVLRVFKLRSAHEISLLFTSLLLTGMLLWLGYGVYFKLAPVILWNTIAAVLVALLLYAKLKYGR